MKLAPFVPHEGHVHGPDVVYEVRQGKPGVAVAQPVTETQRGRDSVLTSLKIDYDYLEGGISAIRPEMHHS